MGKYHSNNLDLACGATYVCVYLKYFFISHHAKYNLQFLFADELIIFVLKYSLPELNELAFS